MESAGKRRRRARTNDSLITDFLDLRDSSVVQTGPKRPRRGDKPPLTPGSTVTPLVGGRSRVTGAVGRLKGAESTMRRNTPRTELAEVARELIDAAAEVSELVPGHSPSSRVPLTPAPSQRSPRRSSRQAGSPVVAETPLEPRKTHRSALKDVQSLPDLRRITRSANSRVSFGEYVTVTEYSIESDRSAEEVGGASPSGPSPTLEPVDEEVDEASPAGSTSPTLEPVEVGGVSPGDPASPTLEPVEDSEAEEQEEESEVEGQSDEGDEGMATPHAPSQTSKGKSPTLKTPAYSEFRPVRRARASPRRGPGRQQPRRPQRQPKTLSRSLVKNLFMLFCKRRLTREAMDLVLKFTEVYLKQASEDLSIYSRHAGRRTIEVSDVILLLRRQRAITSTQSFEYLANTHLPLEYVQELLPCALAGKRVAPKGPV